MPGLLSLATPTRAGINTWTGSGPDGGVVRALAIDPLTPTTVYAGAGTRLFKSTNGGANWSPAEAGVSGTEVRALAVDPTTPTTLYAGTWFKGSLQEHERRDELGPREHGAATGEHGGGAGGRSHLSEHRLRSN